MKQIIQNTKASMYRMSLRGTAVLGAVYAATLPAFAQVQDPFGLSNADKFAGVNKGSLIDQITNITNAVMIVLGILAVLMIIYSGVRLIASRGDEGAMKEAKKVLTYSVIGFVLIALSWGIVRLVISLVGAGNGQQTNTLQEYTRTGGSIN